MIAIPSNERMLAYAAGVFDGEGSVFVHRHDDVPSSIAAVIGNTSKDMIRWFEINFSKAAGCFESRGKDGKLLRPMWRWRVSGDDAAKFLEAIHPYLITKKPQATLALAFVALGGPGTGRKLSSELVERRVLIADAISDLNNGGELPWPI